MERIFKSTNYAVLLLLLTFLINAVQPSLHHNQTSIDNDIILADIGQAFSNENNNGNTDEGTNTDYPESLASLIEYFEGNGVELEELLADSRFEIYEGIGDKFRHSAERKTLSLDEYKRVLGFEAKRSKISDFLTDHFDQLNKAEENYDISRYVIAAIIGIESDFGKNIGSFNPFNAYVSMYAEGYRDEFARAQLEELLKFTSRNNIDVFDLKSSYAGAMSFAQFIPYSLNKWFVGDDIFDMNNNIFSVANYLAYFKERTGSIDKAVFRYNPSQLYTDAVLDLAKEAEAIYTASR